MLRGLRQRRLPRNLQHPRVVWFLDGGDHEVLIGVEHTGIGELIDVPKRARRRVVPAIEKRADPSWEGSAGAKRSSSSASARWLRSAELVATFSMAMADSMSSAPIRLVLLGRVAEHLGPIRRIPSGPVSVAVRPSESLHQRRHRRVLRRQQVGVQVVILADLRRDPDGRVRRLLEVIDHRGMHPLPVDQSEPAVVAVHPRARRQCLHERNGVELAVLYRIDHPERPAVLLEAFDDPRADIVLGDASRDPISWGLLLALQIGQTLTGGLPGKSTSPRSVSCFSLSGGSVAVMQRTGTSKASRKATRLLKVLRSKLWISSMMTALSASTGSRQRLLYWCSMNERNWSTVALKKRRFQYPTQRVAPPPRCDGSSSHTPPLLRRVLHDPVGAHSGRSR